MDATVFGYHTFWMSHILCVTPWRKVDAVEFVSFKLYTTHLAIYGHLMQITWICIFVFKFFHSWPTLFMHTCQTCVCRCIPRHATVPAGRCDMCRMCRTDRYGTAGTHYHWPACPLGKHTRCSSARNPRWQMAHCVTNHLYGTIGILGHLIHSVGWQIRPAVQMGQHSI